MALIVLPRVVHDIVAVWSLTAILLGVLIVYATTQPEKVRGIFGGVIAAAGVAGFALWVDQVFYCPDCCGLGSWFFCWWM